MTEVWMICVTACLCCLVADSGLSKIREHRASQKAQRGKHSRADADTANYELPDANGER